LSNGASNSAKKDSTCLFPELRVRIFFRFSDHEWKAVVQELSLLKEEVDRLREEMGDMKLHFKQVQTIHIYLLRQGSLSEAESSAWLTSSC
jgi:uncharacterized membrane protein